MKKEQLINEAIEILKDYDNVFCECVEELDAWNGYADRFRCYYMSELDDIFYGCKLTEFLEKIARECFDFKDEFFIDTIYGLQSTDDKTEVYRDNVDTGELLDNLIENYCHLDINWIDKALDELLEMIDNGDYDD